MLILLSRAWKFSCAEINFDVQNDSLVIKILIKDKKSIWQIFKHFHRDFVERLTCHSNTSEIWNFCDTVGQSNYSSTIAKSAERLKWAQSYHSMATLNMRHQPFDAERYLVNNARTYNIELIPLHLDRWTLTLIWMKEVENRRKPSQNLSNDFLFSFRKSLIAKVRFRTFKWTSLDTD